ncbi:unnamed protein product, partial [Phaeothamnion confervicola]
KLATTEQQLKASLSRGSAAAAKSQALALQQRRHAEAASTLEEGIAAIFNGVWVHRYRDPCEPVRVECIRALGEWMLALPDTFVVNGYLKYMGWLLSDKGAAVRLRVLQSLQLIYDQQDMLMRIEEFTGRFRPAVVRMVFDVDGAASEAALRLLRRAWEGGLLDDLKEEEREEVRVWHG